MIFKASIAVLKAESRPFKNEQGEIVAWATARVLDSQGNTFDATIDQGILSTVIGLVNVDGTGEFDLYSGKNKEGRPALKLRLKSFVVNK